MSGQRPELLPELWRRIITMRERGPYVQTTTSPWASTTVFNISAHLDASAYWVLVRTAKQFTIPDAMALFIVRAADGESSRTTLPNGQIHSVNDQPALIFKDHSMWYKNGNRHRDVLPAIIWSNGMQVWYQNDEPHRDGDLPAVIGNTGSQFWYQHGELHREFYPALTERDGSQKWHKRGQRHRRSSPAEIDADGRCVWYLHGMPDRGLLPYETHPDGFQQWDWSNPAALIAYYAA